MPVLDTSILVAYLLNEPVANLALEMLTGPAAHAPDIIRLECGNALINALRQQRIEASQVLPRLDLVARLPFTEHDHRPYLRRAVELSLDHHRRPYDGIFIALAERLETVMITTDAKLVRGLHGTPLAKRVRLLG